MYRFLPSLKSMPYDQKSHFASSIIWSQLRLTICKAIRTSETYVLKEFDKMIQCKSGIGRQNPLATWIALWILILCYKEHMIFRKALCGNFGIFDYRAEAESKLTSAESETIYNLNQHLYNMLTSIYSALYQTTSPSTLDWRSKEVASMLGNDVDLINLFSNIKTEMFWFRKCSMKYTQATLRFSK